MTKRLIVGLDNGFGQVKAVTSDGRSTKFPSYYAKAAASLGLKPDHSMVQLPSGDYIVGENARLLARPVTARIDSSWIYEPGFTALAFHAFNKLQVKTGYLVTGLSVEYFNRMKGPLEKIVESWKEFGYDFTLLSTEAQPSGTFWNEYLDDNGAFIKSPAKSRVGIVDMGAGTLDLLEINKGEVTTNFSSSPYGVASAYRDLLLYVMEKHSEGYKMADMAEAISSQLIKVDGKPIDLSKPIQNVKSRYAMYVHYEMRQLWSELNVLDLIVLTGGGAALVKEELLKRLKRPADSVLIPEHSDLANARGYVKFALASGAGK